MPPWASDFLTIEAHLLLPQGFEHYEQAQKLGAPGLDRLCDRGTRGACRPELLGERFPQHAAIEGEHGSGDQDGGGDSVHGGRNPR